MPTGNDMRANRKGEGGGSIVRTGMGRTGALVVNALLCLVTCSILAGAGELVVRYLERPPSVPAAVGPSGAGSARVILGVGESTMVGEPYDPKLTMLDIMRWYVHRASPEVDVQLRYAARKGASLSDLENEAIEQIGRGVSLVVVYAGHNDFLARYGSNLVCKSPEAWWRSILRRSRLLSKLRSTVQRTTIGNIPETADRTLLDRPIVCPEQWDETFAGYRRSLRRILHAASVRAVPTVVIFPGSNEAGYEPNRSVTTLDGSRAAALESAVREGRRLALQGQLDAAEQHLRRALTLDAGFAEAHYRLGELLVRRGAIEGARFELERARDLDGYPWRATAEHRRIIIEETAAAKQHSIDGRAVILGASPTGLLDDSMFHDIHHPSIRGYHALGHAIWETVRAHDLLNLGRLEPVAMADDAAILSAHGFTRVDWHGVLASRGFHISSVIGLTFSSLTRLERLLAYREAARELYPRGVFQLLDGEAVIEDLLSQIRREHHALLGGGGAQPVEGAIPRNAFRELLWFKEAAKSEPPRISIGSAVVRDVLGFGIVEQGKNPNGAPLVVRGAPHPEGFSLHPLPLGTTAYSEAELDLGRRHRRFRISVAIGDSGFPPASARCSVLGDGARLFETPVLRASEAPVVVDVPVAGVLTLVLRCDDAGDGFTLDHVAWFGGGFD